MSSEETSEPKLTNPEALAAWLDSQGLGVGAPLEYTFLSGGSQNEIFAITRGDLRAVLRIPPATAGADRDAGIVRETGSSRRWMARTSRTPRRSRCARTSRCSAGRST